VHQSTLLIAAYDDLQHCGVAWPCVKPSSEAAFEVIASHVDTSRVDSLAPLRVSTVLDISLRVDNLGCNTSSWSSQLARLWMALVGIHLHLAPRLPHRDVDGKRQTVRPHTACTGCYVGSNNAYCQLASHTMDDVEHASCRIPSMRHEISVHLNDYAPSIRQNAADSRSLCICRRSSKHVGSLTLGARQHRRVMWLSYYVVSQVLQAKMRPSCRTRGMTRSIDPASTPRHRCLPGVPTCFSLITALYLLWRPNASLADHRIRIPYCTRSPRQGRVTNQQFYTACTACSS
jgi:hypothetical protein